MDEYFVNQTQRQTCVAVPEIYRQRILQDSARIFKQDQGSVEVISWPKDGKGKAPSKFNQPTIC